MGRRDLRPVSLLIGFVAVALTTRAFVIDNALAFAFGMVAVVSSAYSLYCAGRLALLREWQADLERLRDASLARQAEYEEWIP